MTARRRSAPSLSKRELQHARRRAEAARREQAQRLTRAKRDWERLGPDAQFELAREIVETRGDELKRAYAGVLGIAAGHGRYQRPGAKRRSVSREPMVTFLVRRKWRAGTTRTEGAIPRRLLAYTSIEGQRVLCSVPTDVEDSRDYRLSAQAAKVIVTPPATMPDLTATLGTITCIIRTSATSATRYALSCRHVIGLAESAPPDYPEGAGVSRASGTSPTVPEVASASNIFGLLNPDTNDQNCDVALAELELGVNNPAVRAVVERLGASTDPRYVDSHAAIKALGTYLILTPGGAKSAKYTRGWAPSEQVLVDYGKLGKLRQGVLVIESDVGGTGTIAGDSGSPIVTNDRSLLVGMHFAGGTDPKTGQPNSFMIPAYELVNRLNYVDAGSGQPFIVE